MLVDSEPIANRVLAAALTELGITTTFDQSVARYLGRARRDWLADVEGQFGGPLPEGWAEALRERTHEAFRVELRAVPGVVDALDRIAVPTCVASSGDPGKMQLTLGLTGLLPRFEGRIFSAVEVPRGKPHPDLFLHAAARMGAEPARCVVVEDSPRGVAAAVAAGMRALGFVSLIPAAELAAAGATVFTSMEDLPRLLLGR